MILREDNIGSSFDKVEYILRRNGERTPIDIKKIRAVIDYACEGLNVNPIELESNLTTRIRSGCTTKDIQENLIEIAKMLASIEEPDWLKVAGRLLMWSVWKDVLVNRGFIYGNFVNFVISKVNAKEYLQELLTKYTIEDLEEAANWIDPSKDMNFTYSGAMLLKHRYLCEDELPQEVFLVCSLLIASVETKSKRLHWAKKFFEYISDNYVSLATPILINLRKPTGSLSSCFIVGTEDNLKSIFETITDTAMISKAGGGVGVSISNIRAAGSEVMGRSNSSGGVRPWIKILNDVALAVNQGK